MKGENGRLVQLDLAKVIAFIWIVFFWHLVNYLPYDYTFKLIVYNDYSHCITRTMLSLFVFLSGLFLSKYTFSGKADVYGFYKKRLIRFFTTLFCCLYNHILFWRLYSIIETVSINCVRSEWHRISSGRNYVVYEHDDVFLFNNASLV